MAGEHLKKAFPFMNNLRGIGLMLFAMAGFATADAIIKALTGRFPAGQIIMALGLGGVIFFGALMLKRGLPFFGAWSLNRVILARNLIEGCAAISFVTSLSLVDLTVQAAIIQATPLIVTLGAALVLKEPVGWRRWSAVVLGLMGVLIILQPDATGISFGAFMAVIAAICLAGRDVATRMVPNEASTEALGLYGCLSLVIAALILGVTGPAFVMPEAAEWGWLIAASAFGSISYYAITSAMRVGEVSVLTPFRYMRLLFAMAFGIVFFGERPDIWVYVGSAIVIGTGLYTIARERKRRSAETLSHTAKTS